MYELGLRHTQDKLTVQIGEFGRLPFDVNMIRTIQFSRSRLGLIDARDELFKVLEAGLEGEYDPVTATRVWMAGEAHDIAPVDTDAADNTGLFGDDRGFLDIMAAAEEKQEALVPASEAVGECVVALAELAERSATEIGRSDAAGKGMRGRLQIATKYASSLDRIADQLEAAVDEYESVLEGVSAGTLALGGQMEENAEALDEGREFGMVIRRTAVTARESTGALSEMVAAIEDNARLSRVVKQPSRRLTAALDRFVEATSVMMSGIAGCSR